MIPDDDWQLPPDYGAECQPNGSVILFRGDLRIRGFPCNAGKRAIEAWADAYETGRKAGHQHGLIQGRRALATELRALVQLT